jgi:hypothetical protein
VSNPSVFSHSVAQFFISNCQRRIKLSQKN